MNCHKISLKRTQLMRIFCDFILNLSSRIKKKVKEKKKLIIITEFIVLLLTKHNIINIQ